MIDRLKSDNVQIHISTPSEEKTCIDNLMHIDSIKERKIIS